MHQLFYFTLFLATFLFACNAGHDQDGQHGEGHGQESAEGHHAHEGGEGHSHHGGDPGIQTTHYEQEKHFKNVKQLTFGGDNAEAYFSTDNKYLTMQVTNEKWGTQCDQIFYMPIEGYGDAQPKMVSTGKGKTTCSYFMPGNQQIIYASTHHAADSCLEAPRVVDGKYVWAVHKEFDIFVTDLNGKILKQLTNTPGYDAEPTVSPDGKKIVFTSVRSGDLELWTMDIDGSNQKQVTSGLGYDGGAFFTPDSKGLVFRASRPQTPEAQKLYKDLLAQGLVQPTALEIFVCNVDGSNMRQITNLGGANWAPFMHPSGNSIVFASNHHTESGRQFNIFKINVDGTGLEQVTFDNVFDSFPMFSSDGQHLVFASNRNNGGTRDTNVFYAEWVD
jgi:Tol biopolymer transport system component